MHWILQFIIRHRTTSSFFLCVSLSIAMLASSANNKQGIASALLLSVFYPVQYTVSLTTNIRNIFAENKQLRAEVAALRTHILFKHEDEQTASRINKLFSSCGRLTYNLIPARVIVREPSYILRAIAISVGSKDSITVNMPIITKDGLIGKIIQVLPQVSRVHLIKDPSCRTSVMVKRSRIVGILETNDGNRFFFRCQSHSDIQSFDSVLTSGLGGIYPKGLQIGVVSNIESDRDPLFKIVYVKPSVNFDHLEEVFVVKVAPQWSSLNDDIDSLEMGKP